MYKFFKKLYTFQTLNQCAMAEINISNLGGGGGGTLTLTTTGTGGASTYVAGVLNIPVYQSALTNPVTGTGTATRVAFWDSASSVSSSANLYWDNSNSRLGVGTATPGAPLQVNGTGLTSSTTSVIVKDSGGTDSFTVADNGNTSVRGVLTVTGSSASNSATLMGRTVSGEVTSVTLGTNLSFSGNTLNATGGGTPAGSTGEVQFNNAGAFGASSNFNWDNTNSRLGIGTATPGASLQINGAGATSGTSSLLINNSGASELFRVSDNGLISVGKNVSVSTQSSSQIQAVSGDAATNIVITPKGVGAFILGPPPDGSATVGGNARGSYAVDLQMQRNAADQVASGIYATISGGFRHKSSGDRSTISGGEQNTASALYSTVGGGDTNTASGSYSFVAGGGTNTASSSYSSSFGTQALANLYGAQSFASGRFSTQGDAQTLTWRYRRSITGAGITELSLDGNAISATGRAILVSNRLWNVNLQVSAICSTVGNGVGITLGDSFVGVYQVGIKRLGSTTTLVGTVQSVITAQSDTGMSTSVVTITADDTNECLKVEFTPPTTAGSTTVIRVVVTATATVAGY